MKVNITADHIKLMKKILDHEDVISIDVATYDHSVAITIWARGNDRITDATGWSLTSALVMAAARMEFIYPAEEGR